MSPAPTLAAIDDELLLPLVLLLGARPGAAFSSGRLSGAVVVTGAGISTESGIPDYRSPGRIRKKPMDGRQFNRDPDARRRYWARAFVGFTPVERAHPHAGHRALAALEQSGHVRGVITQNVDGLHLRAKSERLIELHGALSRVRCLACSALESRVVTQARMAQNNPTFAARAASASSEQLPDGDIDLASEHEAHFVVPQCLTCGGDLKPDVVFHGETVPSSRRHEANAWVDEATSILVVGSSLAVESARALTRRARRRNIPLAIINVGPTAADAEAAVVVAGRARDVLPRLAAALVPGAASVSSRSTGAGI